VVIGAIQRFLRAQKGRSLNGVPLRDRPLPFSWILNNQLAIGPLPRSDAHWRQLEGSGFRSRFSCCYPTEEAGLAMPAGWVSDRVSLPDHRDQEDLRIDVLTKALTRSETLLNQCPPLYLHCLAGCERSALLAVGLTVRQRNIDMFEALAWVRRCHPVAAPIYSHLALLETVIKGLTR
jgi:hypothetical protein